MTVLDGRALTPATEAALEVWPDNWAVSVAL
jgi:hypothetical protein